jgi:hypothetical protein
MMEISIFSTNNINTAIQLSETVRTLPQKKLMSPTIKTVAYKLTEEERNKIRKINNSFKSNYVLAYIFLIHKRRKAEYINVLRELRNKIPLNFTQFTILSKDESRSKKRQRIVNNTDNFENKNFDDSDFVQLNSVFFIFLTFQERIKRNRKYKLRN